MIRTGKGLLQDDKGNTSMLRLAFLVILCLTCFLCVGGFIALCAGVDSSTTALIEGVGLVSLIGGLIGKIIQKKIENE